ncbi:response regulator transcription factor [Cohnella endophytica]|nr:response regulator [Cohnella endophytica]
MKILVVDDEARHRRGMLSLIRSLRPDYEVLTANNGLEALATVQSELPEIVFTDIRMPKMDGLAFLEKLHDLKVRPKVVFLSAYNLFEYAQTALRHGAFDYLLKPVDTEKVETILLRIEAHMNDGQAEHGGAKKELPVLAWLNGRLDPPQCDALEKAGIAAGTGLVAYTECACADDGRHAVQGEALRGDLERAWEPFGSARAYLIEAGEEKLRAVTVVSGSELALANRREIRRLLEGMADSSRYEGGKLIHGIGGFCNDLLAQGPDSYRSAHSALRLTFYDRWNGIVFQDERISTSNETLELDAEALFEAVRGGQSDRAIENCRTAFDKQAGDGWTDPARILESASLTVMKLKSRCRELLDRDTAARLTDAAWTEIPACETYFAVLSVMEARLLDLSHALQSTKRGRSEYAMESCVRLIQERYMEELTLEVVAERYYFNSSYFSTMFKSYTGRSFSEYLTEARMKKARELLGDSDSVLKVYAVAELCGYRDTKYFCRLFKKHVGMTPEAYRHQRLGRMTP